MEARSTLCQTIGQILHENGKVIIRPHPIRPLYPISTDSLSGAEILLNIGLSALPSKIGIISSSCFR